MIENMFPPFTKFIYLLIYLLLSTMIRREATVFVLFFPFYYGLYVIVLLIELAQMTSRITIITSEIDQDEHRFSMP